MEISDLLTKLEDLKTDLARKKRTRALTRSPPPSSSVRSFSPVQKQRNSRYPASIDSMRSSTPLLRSQASTARVNGHYNSSTETCATDRPVYTHVPRTTEELLDLYRYPREKVRSYKLDAARLIYSCIKRFLCKHL